PTGLARFDQTRLKCFMPDDIYRGTGKIWIPGRRYPRGERGAAVFIGREAGRLASQELGRDRLLRYRVFHFSLVGQIPGAAVLGGALFHLKPCKESGKAVENILRKDLERMIVTLGAFHSNAEKEPRKRGGG